MKKLNWFLLAMLFLLIPTLQSCDNDEGYSIGQFGGSLATIRVLSGDSYYLESDRYGKLWLASNDVYWYKPVDGQRAFIRFNPLVDNYKEYDMAVKLEWLSPILTKQVEEMNAENEKEFGNDPVTIFHGNIWISNNYLNVIFYQNLPNFEKHRVSLVRNEEAVEIADDGYIHLEYRYNTYGDVSGRWEDGIVSFNLNSLNFEGKKGLKLKLNSETNGEVELKFDLGEPTPAPEATSQFGYGEEGEYMLK